jgi:proteasome lid subunit RPN8/RPN11
MTRTDHDRAADAFQPHGRSKVTLLVQPRPRRNSNYLVYGDALGAPEVYVHMRVLEHLREATLEAVPAETIGALLGRPCRDDYGTYVVVENALTAAHGEYVGSAGAVRISAQGRSAMHHRAAQRHPTLEPVGWWHSHPHGAPRYSSVDRDEQQTYPREHHVGIVVAAERLDDRPAYGEQRLDPLGLYVGPTSALLARRAREPRDISAPAAAVPVAHRTSTPYDAAPVAHPTHASPADGRGPFASGAPPLAPVAQRSDDRLPPSEGSPAPWTSNPRLLGAAVVSTIVFLVAICWMVLSVPDSGPQPALLDDSVPTKVACPAGSTQPVELDRPARGVPVSADASIATGLVQGAKLTVRCKAAGRTALTIDDEIVRQRVDVRVAPASGKRERPK